VRNIRVIAGFVLVFVATASVAFANSLPPGGTFIATKTTVRSPTRGGGFIEVRPRARVRNAAICPLVTWSLGQNLSLTGGLHPKVTFAVPSLSAAFS